MRRASIATSPTTRATRDRILAGASVVIGERGVPDTTVREVLEAAQVSRRTFYLYFKGLDGVLLALYERSAQSLVTLMGRRLASAQTPQERLDAAVAAYLDHLAEGGHQLIALQAEAARPDSPLAAQRERAVELIIQLLDDSVYQSVGQRLDSDVYRVLLEGIYVVMVRLHRDGPLEASGRERVRRLVSGMFLAMLRSRALLPPGVAGPETSRPA